MATELEIFLDLLLTAQKDPTLAGKILAATNINDLKDAYAQVKMQVPGDTELEKLLELINGLPVTVPIGQPGGGVRY